MGINTITKAGLQTDPMMSNVFILDLFAVSLHSRMKVEKYLTVMFVSHRFSFYLLGEVTFNEVLLFLRN